MVIFFFLILVAFVYAVLFTKDRQQEWRLRQEQANHRLQLGFELINRDLDRVRSDVLQAANLGVVRNHDPADNPARAEIQREFSNFLRYKPNYQQIRLVDRSGLEAIRAERTAGQIRVSADDELQDKSDRYYVRESRALSGEQVFVSEFDLNQEHGAIERPLNPVIRFVAAVADEGGVNENLLVINYRGSPLLQELQNLTLPGQTLLLREDGQYILASRDEDAWGWLLGHNRSFAEHFPEAWRARNVEEDKCHLTDKGAFAFRTVELQRFGYSNVDESFDRGRLWVVSWLDIDEVFATSNRLLRRLTLLTAFMMLPLFALTRYWAVASVRRKQQNEKIQESEEKLRELSTRLIQIQEDERRAISREIHDQLGQQVTALNLDLKLAHREQLSPAGQEQLKRAIDESEQLLHALHDFATRVRPDVLDDFGLHDAIESHLWEFENRTSIEVRLESSIKDVEIPPIIAENVFRLVQESLNNVLKHSHATRVDVAVELRNTGDSSDLFVRVSDDGVGAKQAMEHPDPSDGQRLGILGMQERVELLGGSIKFLSESSGGTAVQVCIPLNPQNPQNGNRKGLST